MIKTPISPFSSRDRPRVPTSPYWILSRDYIVKGVLLGYISITYPQ